MITKIITNKSKTSALLIQAKTEEGTISLLAETPKLSHKAGRVKLTYNVEEIREIAAALIAAADSTELAIRGNL